jgi:hypothetical protein
MGMNIWLQGFLIGLGLAAVLIIFEYTAIKREVAEREARVAKKNLPWDSNQISRMRGMMTFGAALPFGCSVGAWLISKM